MQVWHKFLIPDCRPDCIVWNIPSTSRDFQVADTLDMHVNSDTVLTVLQCSIELQRIEEC